MSYNLKDHINEWVNIELSIDNTNNQAELFINGSKKDTFTYDKKLTKNSQSKLHFGSRADRSKGFRGKLENINISNSKTNETISSAKYNQLKGNSKKQMFNMDFKNTSSSSRKVSERSKFKSSAKFDKPDGETGATLVADEGKDAVNFSSGDFMEIDAGASMNGESLKNSTFTSWVKLPPTSSGYEPIISRENVFSFGINNGHASLFLSQNNQLAPGANITKTEQALAVVDETFAKATFGQNDSLVKVNKNGSVVNNVMESDMIEYSGVANSKALKLTTNDKVEIDKLAYTGRNLSKFSMSMWMKPDILTDNMVLFSRPEMGLALKANSSGKLNLEYTKLTEEYTLRLLGHHSGTTGVISMTRIKAYNGTTEVPIALVKEAEPRSGKNNLAALTQENNTSQVQWGNPDNTTELAALVGEKIVTIQSTSEITRIEIEWDATYTGTFDVLSGNEVLTVTNSENLSSTPKTNTITLISENSYKYDFYVSKLPGPVTGHTTTAETTSIQLTEISCNNVTLNSTMFASHISYGGSQNNLFNNDITETGGLLGYTNFTTNTKLFTIYSEIKLNNLTISAHRTGYLPGFRITENDTELINESSNNGSSATSPFSKTYTLNQ